MGDGGLRRTGVRVVWVLRKQQVAERRIVPEPVRVPKVRQGRSPAADVHQLMRSLASAARAVNAKQAADQLTRRLHAELTEARQSPGLAALCDERAARRAFARRTHERVEMPAAGFSGPHGGDAARVVAESFPDPPSDPAARQMWAQAVQQMRQNLAESPDLRGWRASAERGHDLWH